MQDPKKDILFRTYILYGAVCFFAAIIVCRIFFIQVIEGPELRAKADKQILEYRNIEPLRGNIFSADGNFLAISVPIYEIRMDTRAEGLKKEKFQKNVDSLAFKLADLFKDKSKDDYKKLLKDGYNRKDRYLLIKKEVSFSQLQKLVKFPLFKLGQNRGGLIAISESKRIKPYKNLAARTIGRYDDKGKPIGIEGAFNDYLTGTEGVRLMQKLANGMWRPVTEDYEIEPENGADVYTTIDVNLQDVAQDELKRQLSLHNADHGCVVMMEVKTGDVKAISNLTRNPVGDYIESYNYAIGESVEPGSTFKLASLMAAMEDGLITLNDSVSTGDGTFKYADDAIMKDSHQGGYGRISVKRAFELSSNVAVSKIIWSNYKQNPEKFIARIKKFHLHEPLDIEIPGEGMPKIKDVKDKDWSKTTLPWMSIGYESRLTALQILTFYNAVANNGCMVKPRFVNEVKRRGQPIENYAPEIIDPKIASEQTIKQARMMLEGVVENGTAKNLKGLVYKIGGKTGTAQVANGNKGYKGIDGSGVTYRASFVGYFPANEPKYSCIVVVSAPSNSVYYGNLVAGPIFKAVSDKIYAATLDIHDAYNKGRVAISDTNQPEVKSGYTADAQTVLGKLNITNIRQNTYLGFSQSSFDKNKIVFNSNVKESKNLPDVRGMGAKDAIYLLENLGLKVNINGKGAVTQQLPVPGSIIKKGSPVTLILG